MDTKTVTFNVPEELLEQAENAGILTDETITNLLYKELERQEKIKRFFEVIDKLKEVQPPLTQEAIDAAIQAYRKGE